MATTNESNPRGNKAVVISIVFVAIASLFVAFRFVARLGLVRRCGIDDALIVCALGLSISLTALIKVQEQHGMGKHLASLAPNDYVASLQPLWISILTYNLGLACTKCSILCQFLRFFVTQTARRVCYAFLAFMVTYGFVTLLGGIFSCTPVAYFWNRALPGGHCVNLLGLWFSNATINIMSDITLCILPIPVLKSLQLPRKQKYVLLFVFALGGFGCVTSILRLHSLYIVSRSTDVTWDNVGAATWSSIELNTGIICACLPTLKPVLAVIFPGFMQSSRTRNTAELQPNTYERHSAGFDKIATRSSTNRNSAYQLENGTWADMTQAGKLQTGHQYSWSIDALAEGAKSPVVIEESEVTQGMKE